MNPGRDFFGAALSRDHLPNVAGRTRRLSGRVWFTWSSWV